jgi:hypothetical protein
MENKLFFSLVMSLLVIGLVSAQTIDIYSNSKEPQRSQEERECINEKMGCWTDNKCYPLGYIKDNQYCSYKGKVYYSTNYYEPGFLNQSETRQECIQGYECKTGICSNNICVNLTEQKQELEFLKEQVTQLISDNQIISQENDSEEIENNNKYLEEETNIVRKIVNYFRNLFN